MPNNIMTTINNAAPATFLYPVNNLAAYITTSIQHQDSKLYKFVLGYSDQHVNRCGGSRILSVSVIS